MDFLIQSLRAAKLREVHINQKVPIMKVKQKVPDAAQFPEPSQAEVAGCFARYRIHVDIEKKDCFLLQGTMCWVLPAVRKSPTAMACQSVRMVTVAARPG